MWWLLLLKPEAGSGQWSFFFFIPLSLWGLLSLWCCLLDIHLFNCSNISKWGLQKNVLWTRTSWIIEAEEPHQVSDWSSSWHQHWTTEDVQHSDEQVRIWCQHEGLDPSCLVSAVGDGNLKLHIDHSGPGSSDATSCWKVRSSQASFLTLAMSSLDSKRPPGDLLTFENQTQLLLESVAPRVKEVLQPASSTVDLEHLTSVFLQLWPAPLNETTMCRTIQELGLALLETDLKQLSLSSSSSSSELYVPVWSCKYIL